MRKRTRLSVAQRLNSCALIGLYLQITNEQMSEAHQRALTENEDKAGKLEQLEGAPSKLEALKQRKGELSSDTLKFETLIANLEAHQIKLSSKLESTEREKQLRLKEKEGFAEEKERLATIHSQQELTPADVERITTARQLLDDEMAVVSQRKADMDQRAWKQEVALAKTLDETKELVAQYNTRAEALQLIPAQSKIAGGVDFEMHINSRAAQPDQELLLNNLETGLLPALGALKQRLVDSKHDTANEAVHLEEAVRKTEEQIVETSRAVEDAERKLKKAEGKYNLEKEAMESEQKEWAESLHKIEGDSLTYQTSTNGMHDGTVRQIEELKLKYVHVVVNSQLACAYLREFVPVICPGYMCMVCATFPYGILTPSVFVLHAWQFCSQQELEVEMQREKDEMDELIYNTLELLTNHKARVQEMVSEYRATVDEVARD